MSFDPSTAQLEHQGLELSGSFDPTTANIDQGFSFDPSTAVEDNATPSYNVARGAVSRGSELLGNLFGAAGIAAEKLEEKLPMGGLVFEKKTPFLKSELKYLPKEKYQELREQEGFEEPLPVAAKYWKGKDYGYVPTHTWEKLKETFKSEGVTGSSMGEVLSYASEQGIKSIPDMVAVVTNLPLYVTSRSGEIGETRAKNKGKDKAELGDIIESVPFAVGSAILERIGAKGMTTDVVESVGKGALKSSIKKIAVETGKGAGKEALTEFAQEGIIEYVGEKFGTQAEMSVLEAIDRGAAGAVAGGVYGGTVAGGTASGTEAVNLAKTNQIIENIDGSENIDEAIQVATDTLRADEIEREETLQNIYKESAEEIALEENAVPLGGAITQEATQITPEMLPDDVIIQQEAVSASESTFQEPLDRETSSQIGPVRPTQPLQTEYSVQGDAGLGADRRQADRRQDFAMRKRVAEMTEEEKSNALLIDDLMQIPNYRAFQEHRQDNPDEQVMYGDIDDFKSYNTRYGHSETDKILQYMGDIQRELANEMGVTGYRRSGDEFLATGNQEVLGKYSSELQNRLADAIVEVERPDGTIAEHKGIGFSYGVGIDEATAEKASDTQKEQRKQAGLRLGERDIEFVPDESTQRVEDQAGIQTGISDEAKIEVQEGQQAATTEAEVLTPEKKIPSEQKLTTTEDAPRGTIDSTETTTTDVGEGGPAGVGLRKVDSERISDEESGEAIRGEIRPSGRATERAEDIPAKTQQPVTKDSFKQTYDYSDQAVKKRLSLGVPEKTINDVVNKFTSKLKNKDIKINVVNEQSELGEFDKPNRFIQSVIDKRSGELRLVRKNFSSAKEVEKALRHEVLWHHGFSLFDDKTRNDIYDKINATRTDNNYQKAWDQIKKDYSEYGDDIQAEEFLASLQETDQGRLSKVYNEVIAMVQKALRSLGWEGQITKAEIKALLSRVERKAVKGGKPKQKDTVYSQKEKQNTDDFVAFIKEKYPIKSFHVYETRKGDLKLDTIIVEKDNRKKGIGTKIINELINHANTNNKRIVVTPAIKDDFQGTTSRSRLVKFYKRFGFVENKGRKKDFTISEGMYRDPDVLYSQKAKETTMPWFFSGLKRAAENIGQEKGTAQQFLSMLKKQPGVKAEELEWTGLEEYLRAQGPKKITKQEIIDFLDQNGVQVETVEKGVAEPYNKWKSLRDKIIARSHASSEETRTEEWWTEQRRLIKQRDKAEELMDEYAEKNNIEDFEEQTKFSDYQLLGGQNYREVLLTFPLTNKQLKITEEEKDAYQKLKNEEKEARAAVDSMKDEVKKENDLLTGEYQKNLREWKQKAESSIYGDYEAEIARVAKERFPDRPDGKSYAEPIVHRSDFFERVRDKYMKENPPPKEPSLRGEDKAIRDRFYAAMNRLNSASIPKPAGFKSSHFDEPNILAHIRLNDRIDADGNKVLFVEEIQSDWHQQGRKKGYSNPKLEKQIRENEEFIFDYADSLHEELLSHQKKRMDGESSGHKLIDDVSISEIPMNVSRGKITISVGDGLRNELSKDATRRTVSEIVEGYEKEGSRYYDFIYKIIESKGDIDQITKKNQFISSNKQIKFRGVPNAPFKGNAWAELAIKRVLRMAAEGGYDSVAWTTGEQQAERYDLSKRISEIKYSDKHLLRAYDHNGNEVLKKPGLKPEDLPDYIGKDAAEKLLNQRESYNSRTLKGQDLKVGGEGMKGFYDRILPNLFKKVTGKLDKSVRVGPTDLKDFESWSIPITNEMRDSVMGGQVLFSQKKEPSNKTQKSFMEKAGLLKERRNILGRIVDYKNEGWEGVKEDISHMSNTTAQGLFDRFHSIKAAETEAKGGVLPAEQSGYVAARLSAGTDSVMRAILNYGAPQWKDNIIQRKQGSKGLLEIFDGVKEDMDSFLGWMVARRADRLMKEGKEHNFTKAEIKEGLALSKGKEKSFEKSAKEYDQFRKSVLDLAEQAGLIDPDTRKAWDKSDHVPFYRMTSEEVAKGPRGKKGLSGQTSGIRRLKGGEAALNDPLQNIILNFTHLIDASMKNHALRQTLVNIKDSDFVTQMPSSQYKPALVSMSQVRESLEADGVDTSQIDDDVFKGVQKLWSFQAPKDKDVVRVMDGGKAKYFRVNDPMLLQSLTAVQDAGLNSMMAKVLRIPKRLLTAGVTASPDFMLRNFLRDSVHSWVISEDHFRLGVDSIRGAWDTLRVDDGTLDMMFSGASFLSGYIDGTDPGKTAKAIRRSLRKKGYSIAKQKEFMESIVDTPAKFWDKYRSVGDSIENASREAVYKAAIKAGKSKAQAVYEAKDLMDFSMQGAWQSIQWANLAIPFLNARLQGLYKLGRSGAIPGPKARKQALMRGTSIALASLALYAVNKDNEDYDDLEDWDKDMFWHFFPGDRHFRIPKPFEVGLIFGTIPERAAQNILGADDNAKSFERFLWNIKEVFAFTPAPQAIVPIIEVYANKDTFTGRPIESMSDVNKLPAERYNERTSDITRMLGQQISNMTEISPKQMEHLLTGYTGTMGAYILSMADHLYRLGAGKVKKPAIRADQIPLVKSLYRADPPFATKYQTEFYDMLKEAQQAAGSINAYKKESNKEKAEQIYRDYFDEIKRKKYLSKTQKNVSKLNDQMNAIYRDKKMSKSAKRKKLDELLEKKNKMLKKTVLKIER